MKPCKLYSWDDSGSMSLEDLNKSRKSLQAALSYNTSQTKIRYTMKKQKKIAPLPKSKIVKKYAKKHGIPVKDIKVSELDPADLKGIPTRLGDTKAFPDVQPDAWEALVECEKRSAQFDREIAQSLTPTWFDWMTYMESTHGDTEGWKLLKAAIISKPKVLGKKSEPGLIAGYSPRQLEFIVKTYNKSLPYGLTNRDLSKVVEEIQNK